MSILTDGSEPVAGVLYLVGTPIGNLGDLTPRAQRVLAGVQRIACEDTRRSGLLLHHLGLSRAAGGPPLLSFHQHNQLSRIPELLAALEAGEAIAVVSDAGLPGISDPGEALVAAARQAGLPVVCIPGPSAVTTALVSSGLPSGRFCFEGFLPAKSSQRRQRLQELLAERRTMVMFEAPHRLLELLEDLLRCHTPQASARDIQLELSPDPTCHSVPCPTQDRERVFERFWSGADRGGHSGLGLAIGRAIARRHSSELRLGESRAGRCELVVALPAMDGR